MAASSLTVRPSAVDIARATAAAIPSEVSTRPLLGIIGVVIGAGLVTLTGRMLSKLCETGRFRAFEQAYLIERAVVRARKQLATLTASSKQ